VTSPTLSLILPAGARPERLRATLESLHEQSLTPEVIAVVTSDRRDAARRAAPSVDALVEIDRKHWTLARALNAGSAAATAPIHATIEPGRELPRNDWLERILAHHCRDEIAGVSGARRDRDQQLLFEPQDLDARSWSERLSFSTEAAGWRAAAWSTHPFPEDVVGAAGQIWAWRILRAGSVLVVDPFLQLDGPPLDPPSTWSIFRRTADEWTGLVSVGAPVAVPSFAETVRSWWSDIDATSATPPALQRLNYYRLARALGRWTGGRRARSAAPPPR
jgi:hypothetical protein